MPKTIRLVAESAHPDGLIVPALGRVVQYGEDVEVSDELAGTAPSWEPHTTTMTDLGSGMLAQHDIWVDPAAAPREEGQH